MGPSIITPDVIEPIQEPESAIVPLSKEQEQIWLDEVLASGQPLYNETVTIRYRGELHIPALEWSFDELSQRHEILRTTIQEYNGAARQVVGAATPIKLKLLDLSNLPENKRKQELAHFLSAFATRPFDLSCDFLFRAFVACHGPHDHRIYLTLHHLIFDGASLRQILLPELVELYGACTAGRSSMLPWPHLQYRDYSCWQRAKSAVPREAGIAFWRSKLADLSPLALPQDRPRTPQTGRRGAMQSFQFDERFSSEIRERAHRDRTTTFNILLASFVALLARYADTSDVTLGTLYGGRARTELEGVLGCFLNTILLRTDLSGDVSFRELLKRVREVTLEALDNVDIPFQEVRKLLPRVRGDESPVQVLFSFQPPIPTLPSEWDVDVFAICNGAAKADLSLEIEERNGAFRGRLLYNSDLFDAVTLEDMQQHWMTLLRAAIREPERSIWSLPLLRDLERNWLLHDLNKSDKNIPQLCVHDLFVRKAAEAADRVAISFEGRIVSYGQLDQWSASIAHHISAIGIRPGSVVGLMVERSPAMIAALLGILRAGSTYVPLDPKYPAARLAHMMTASRVELLLTQHSLVSRLFDVHTRILDIANCPMRLSDVLSNQALPEVSLSASAYVLFTSGSTGVPKGVEIPHRALTNLLWSVKDSPGIEAHDVLLAVTSIGFDIAALECFLPLIAGARIELASSEEARDPDLLRKKIAQSGVTMLQATPVSWRMLIESGWSGPRGIKVLSGGEALTENLASQLLQYSDSVWNLYGPTETTIYSTCGRIRSAAAQISLGTPIANTSLYVLDTHQALVPAGVTGELYIGGAGLAKGYCGQPELTSERFPTITLDHGQPMRLYRTGDRVKRLRNGSLLFVGRTDRQIKLRGNRIELGEIEQVINSLPGVQESIVIKADHPSRGELLAAFVIPKTGACLDVDELRSGLKILLPSYMEPGTIQVLTEAPLTPNGKLDRKRLPQIIIEEKAITAAEQPLSGTEQKLADIWCDLLQLKSVDRQESFFDLGGHSLLATRMIARVNRAFDRTIPVVSLFQAPTIAQFAHVIEGGSTPHGRLATRGSSPANQLFWIGADAWLMKLAQHMTGRMNLYTVTLDPSFFGRMESMAARLVEQIRELQPRGPYPLGGFCLHGLLAYEVAQQLRQAGEEVPLLILTDLYAPGRTPNWTRAERVIRRARREALHLSVMKHSEPKQWFRYVQRRLQGSNERRKYVRQTEENSPQDLQQALYMAERSYEIAPLPDKVLFLESEEGALLGQSTSDSWAGLLKDIEIFSYPGVHQNILNGPLLEMAAEKIQEAVARATSIARTH